MERKRKMTLQNFSKLVIASILRPSPKVNLFIELAAEGLKAHRSTSFTTSGSYRVSHSVVR
jgi:hypothetical protein